MDLTNKIQIAVARADLIICSVLRCLQRVLPAIIILIVAMIVLIVLRKRR